jgi:hypothetical protein
MLSNDRLIPGTIQRLRLQLQVAIEEESDAVAMVFTVRQHAVARTAVESPGVLLHHIAHVDHERIGDDRHWDPRVSWRVIHLEPNCAFLLQKDGNAAEVRVIGHCCRVMVSMGRLLVALPLFILSRWNIHVPPNCFSWCERTGP